MAIAAAGLIAALWVQGLIALPAAAASWTSTGAMTTARRSHTATLLSDGRVLAAAGRGSTTPLATAEIYSPATRMWTATGSLAVNRQLHTATLLTTGEVLAAGGLTRSSNNGNDFLTIASSELYNTTLGAWRQTGALREPRDSHTATLLPDGQVLVAGGITNFPLPDLRSAELYNPTAGAWAPTGDMTVSRVNHTATLLSNGKVLAAGGQDNAAVAQASAELYTPGTTGTWSSTGSLAVMRKSHTATLLPNGKVLVTGGRDASNQALASTELYDPSTGKWTAADPLSTPRADHTATLVGGRVLVVGGSTNATAELYDPTTGKWSGQGSLATARSQHTATPLAGGRVLVAGGCGASCPLSTSEVLLAADLSLTKTDASDPVVAGRTLRYTLSARNAGPDAAQAASVRDELPDGVTFVSGSRGCSAAAGVVTCSLGDLASGESAERQITVRPSAPTSALSNTATVQSVTFDPVAANDSASATTVVNSDPSGDRADLSITPSAVAPARGPVSAAVQSAAALAAAIASDARRAGDFRSCLAKAAAATKRRGKGRVSPRARRRGAALQRAARRRCLTLYARTPGRITGLSARALSSTEVALSFNAPGTDGSRPPAARSYVVKQALRSISGARGFGRARSLCGRVCRFSVTEVGARITLTITDLRPRTTYYYAAAARDNVSGRLGPRSQTVTARTR